VYVSQPNGSIRVEIYDQSYNLRGSDPEYIQKLAEFVDAKMRAVAEHTSTVDSLRVAVLAALNITDELLSLKAKYENVSTEYTDRAAHLQHALESALDEVLQERRVG
jgi:cell division protein ZapA